MTPGMLPGLDSPSGLSTPLGSPPTAPSSTAARSVDSILAVVVGRERVEVREGLKEQGLGYRPGPSSIGAIECTSLS